MFCQDLFLSFKIIFLDRCCLMLNVFSVCDDWWWTWSSCYFNKLLFVFTAQSHASLQHSCVCIQSFTADKYFILVDRVTFLIFSGKRLKTSALVFFPHFCMNINIKIAISLTNRCPVTLSFDDISTYIKGLLSVYT